MLKKALALTSIVIIQLLIGYVLWACTIYSNPNEEIMLIDKGSQTSLVSEILKNKKIIADKNIFRAYSLYQSRGGKYIQPGEYQFPAGMTMLQVHAKLAKGERLIRKILIPEGLNIKEITELLDNTYGLTGTISANFKDGELMPDTYHYFYGDSKDNIAKAMKQQMDAYLDDLLKSHPQVNKNELLTMASLVEKETNLANERKIVASVYYNRLQKGMLLQADPSVVYIKTMLDGKAPQRLLYEDLKIDSPYNTYVHKGLPPAPITNPGKASIEAALNPDKTDFLYFVADGKGGHIFSKSMKEHEANVSNYRKSEAYLNIIKAENNKH